jgi:hypothetical protein
MDADGCSQRSRCLRGNDTGSLIKPSRPVSAPVELGCCFTAIGLPITTFLFRGEIQSLLGQWRDGMVPHRIPPGPPTTSRRPFLADRNKPVRSCGRTPVSPAAPASDRSPAIHGRPATGRVARISTHLPAAGLASLAPLAEIRGSAQGQSSIHGNWGR